MASFGNHKWQIERPLGIKTEFDRTIGFECEVTVENQKTPFYAGNCNSAVRICRENGIETDQQEIAVIYFDAHGAKIGGYGVDGDDKEFVTEPMSFSLIKNERDYHLANFAKWLKQNCECRPGSGTHIHVGKLTHDGVNGKDTYENIYNMLKYFGYQTQNIFGRVTHWASIPALLGNTRSARVLCDTRQSNKIEVPIEDIGNLGTDCHADPKGFMAINRETTYEFRGGKATVDLLELRAWAEFCHNFVDIASKYNDLSDIRFSDLLIGKHIEEYVKKVVQKNSRRKLSDKDINTPIKDIKTVTCWGNSGRQSLIL